MSSEPVVPIDVNPELDLVLDRVVPVPLELVWRAWTEAELLKQWFCPRPWRVTEAHLDVRPGGRFFTVMQGPEDGQTFASEGCFLEVVHHQRLRWTDALAGGYRPNAEAFMTAALELTEVEGGTRYRAIAQHASVEAMQKHVEMGFNEGWSAALDQLVELSKTL